MFHGINETCIIQGITINLENTEHIRPSDMFNMTYGHFNDLLCAVVVVDDVTFSHVKHS
jgi:hypothetical protein